jgi:hypothetical protein
MQVFRGEPDADVFVVNGRRPSDADARALLKYVKDPEDSAALFEF